MAGIAIYALTPTNYSSMQQPGKARNQADKKQGGEVLFGSSLLCIIHSSHNAVSPGYCPTNTHKFYSVTKNTNKYKWMDTDKKKFSLVAAQGSVPTKMDILFTFFPL